MKTRFLFLVFCLLSLLSAPGQTTPDIDQARHVIKDGLDAKDPDERIQAIQASGLIGLNERLRAQLEEALNDNNVEDVLCNRLYAHGRVTAVISAL